MIDTRHLDSLPGIDELRRLLQSLAMLDAILSPDWQGRYYSFSATWAAGEQMGSMRNGSGDHFFAHFGPAGCWLKGFAHESPMSPFRNEGQPTVWPGVLESASGAFAACLHEPAFNIEETTFCLWRKYSDAAWKIGEIAFPPDADPDGSANLLSPLDGLPQTYADWAADYYESDISLAAVEHVYRQLPLSTELLAQLNPDVTLAIMEAERLEIGYPG